MKYETRSHKNKSRKPWFPRTRVLIPAHKVMRTVKDYDRKKEQDVEHWLREY